MLFKKLTNDINMFSITVLSEIVRHQFKATRKIAQLFMTHYAQEFQSRFITCFYR